MSVCYYRSHRMTAIAIDDEPLALDVIKAHAAKVPFVELLQTFTSPFAAADFLQREKVDLLFLDINMPDISGIELFQSLTVKPLVIFTTAYSEYAVEGFELDAIDFLMKPISFARFLKACNKAADNLKQRGAPAMPDHLFLKTGFEQVKVLFDEIMYLEASGNYVTFVTAGKKILTRMTFGEVEGLLPKKKFVRVHRSFIVAVSKIEKVERHQVTIARTTVPVSDAYTDVLQQALKNTK